MDIFDFHDIFIMKDDFIKHQGWRNVRSKIEDRSGTEFFILDLKDEDIYDAVLHDVLAVTMFELQTNQSLSFTKEELLMFVEERDRKEFWDRVRDQDRGGLLTPVDGQFRIKKDWVTLQFVMDRVGCWYTGFIHPKDVQESLESDEELKPDYQILDYYKLQPVLLTQTPTWQ